MMGVNFREPPFVRVYVEDFSYMTSEKYLSHLNGVFDVIEKVGLKYKLPKCIFTHAKIKLLSHLVHICSIYIARPSSL